MFSFASVWLEKQMNRDTKLIAILRRQYGIILMVLEENIYSILGFVTSRLRPIWNIFSSN